MLHGVTHPQLPHPHLHEAHIKVYVTIPRQGGLKSIVPLILRPFITGIVIAAAVSCFAAGCKFKTCLQASWRRTIGTDTT